MLVFASPVASEMAALAGRLGWPVTLLDPDPARLAGATASGTAGLGRRRRALDAGCDVVVCDHERPELGDVLADGAGRPDPLGRRDGQPAAHRPARRRAAGARPAEDQIARVHRPIGLDIGSRTPPEIAISTVAGLLADRNGRPGGAVDAG